MNVRLVIVAPASARKAYKVRLPVVVGRGEEAKVRLEHDSVSRRHCEFTADEGVVHVTDLGSTNGTLVDASRAEPHAATAVSNGAQVRIGGVVLRVEYAAAAAARAPVSAADDTVTLPPVADTVRHDDASAVPPEAAEPVPAVESAAAEFPAAAAAPPAADFAALAGADVAPPPAEGSFGFLGDEAAAPAEPDDKLDDFFKSLS